MVDKHGFHHITNVKCVYCAKNGKQKHNVNQYVYEKRTLDNVTQFHFIPRKMIFTLEFLADIFLHVGGISALLGIIFFTYGHYIEQLLVEIEMKELVDGYMVYFDNFIQVSHKSKIGAYLNGFGGFKVPDMSSDDAAIEEKNKTIVNRAAIALGTGFVVCWTIAFIIARLGNKKVNLTHLMVENVVILFAVAVTEIIFATFIVRYYRVVDPNTLKLALVGAFSDANDYAKNNPTEVRTLTDTEVGDLVKSVKDLVAPMGLIPQQYLTTLDNLLN